MATDIGCAVIIKYAKKLFIVSKAVMSNLFYKVWIVMKSGRLR